MMAILGGQNQNQEIVAGLEIFIFAKKVDMMKHVLIIQVALLMLH